MLWCPERDNWSGRCQLFALPVSVDFPVGCVITLFTLGGGEGEGGEGVCVLWVGLGWGENFGKRFVCIDWFRFQKVEIENVVKT